MAGLKYIPFYPGYMEDTSDLSDSEFRRLMYALAAFCNGEEPPEPLTGKEVIAYRFITRNIRAAQDQYNAKCKANSENAKKRTQATASERKRTQANANDRKRTQANASDRKRTQANASETSQNKEQRTKTKDNMMMMKNTREDETPEPGIDAQACFECYEQNIGTMSRAVYDEIKAYLQQLPADLVCEAIQEAARNNARSWKYAETILRGCLQKNILTKAAYLSEQEARKCKASSRQSAGQRRSTQETLRRIAMGGSDDISADSSAFIIGDELLG